MYHLNVLILEGKRCDIRDWKSLNASNFSFRGGIMLVRLTKTSSNSSFSLLATVLPQVDINSHISSSF